MGQWLKFRKHSNTIEVRDFKLDRVGPVDNKPSTD